MVLRTGTIETGPCLEGSPDSPSWLHAALEGLRKESQIRNNKSGAIGHFSLLPKRSDCVEMGSEQCEFRASGAGSSPGAASVLITLGGELL